MKYHLEKAKKKSQIRYKVWFEQAGFDLKGGEHSKNGEFYEWACYQTTQAVEKALKSIIMHAGWRHPKTHKLSVLIGLCNSLDNNFLNTKFKFRELELFTFISRYPFLVPGENKSPHFIVSNEDAERCIEEATQILSITSKILKLPYEGEFKESESIDVEVRLTQIVKKIVDNMNPKRIVLFGGYAKGDEKLSTLDILIIAETNQSFVDRVRTVREITKGGLPVVHPIIYTPEEYSNYLEEGHSFLEKIEKEGRVLYEKS